MSQHSGYRELADSFDERLANANAEPTQERRETVWIALHSTRRQVVLAVCVESLRNEFPWLDPLVRVVAELVDPNLNWIVLLDEERTTLGRLAHAKACRHMAGTS